MNVINFFYVFLFINYFCISIFAQKIFEDVLYPSRMHTSRHTREDPAPRKQILEVDANNSRTISLIDIKKAIRRAHTRRFPETLNYLFASGRAGNLFDRELRSKRTRKSRKKYRNGHKGRRKNSEIIGIRKSKSQEVTASPIISSLCPDWPNNPEMLVNCSNGREFRSVCSISCIPGFRLRRGTPRKRRCRVRGKGRRRKTPKHLRLAWSGKDERFECVSVCDDLSTPNNGRVVCGNGRRNESINARTLRSCVVNCDPGFVPSSFSPRYCLDNGTWSGITTTCQEFPSKQKESTFHLHQRFECGNIQSLTTFGHRKKNYLAAGDVTKNQTRIYRWSNDRFVEWQTLQTVRPLVVEAVLGKQQHLWLLVGNEKKTVFYLLNKQNRFIYTHSKRDYLITAPRPDRLRPVEGFNMMRSGSDIYRCRGQRSATGRSVLIVQKLQKQQKEKSKRPSFKRTLRKKFRKRWSMIQCLMFVENKKFFTAATLRKDDGEGKILIGVEENRRMRVVQTVIGENLRNLSDLELVQTVNGRKIFVFAQSISNGTCSVYEKKFIIPPHHARTAT